MGGSWPEQDVILILKNLATYGFEEHASLITRQIHQTLKLWLALHVHKPDSEATSCMSLWIHTFLFDNVIFNSYLYIFLGSCGLIVTESDLYPEGHWFNYQK